MCGLLTYTAEFVAKVSILLLQLSQFLLQSLLPSEDFIHHWPVLHLHRTDGKLPREEGGERHRHSGSFKNIGFSR